MESVSLHSSISENFIERLAIGQHPEISEAVKDTAPVTNLQRLQECYRRIARGDFTAMTALMADNVEMEFVGPSEVPIAGRWQGKENVQAASEANFAKLADQQANLIGIAAPGNDVILFAKEQGRIWANGATYNLLWSQQYTFQDGLIVRLRCVFASPLQAPAAGADGPT